MGAPFLGIDMLTGVFFPDFVEANPWFSGFTGLLYITGWLASMEGLRRLLDTPTRDLSWYAIRIVMFTLVIADVSNIWAMVSTQKPVLFYILDAGWPVSNLLMLLVAWAVFRSGQLKPYGPLVTLAMGLWLPVSLLLGRSNVAFCIDGIYSALVWVLFAWVVMKARFMPVLAVQSLFINHKNFN